jgi:hypothetical protein
MAATSNVLREWQITWRASSRNRAGERSEDPTVRRSENKPLRQRPGHYCANGWKDARRFVACVKTVGAREDWQHGQLALPSLLWGNIENCNG